MAMASVILTRLSVQTISLISHLCQKFLPLFSVYIIPYIDVKTKKSGISNGKDNINLKWVNKFPFLLWCH